MVDRGRARTGPRKEFVISTLSDGREAALSDLMR
jgi:hypothetical protein